MGRSLVEVLELFQAAEKEILLWQAPLDSVDEFYTFTDKITSEERFMLKGVLVSWGIKPNEYVQEPIWNLVDKMIKFYKKKDKQWKEKHAL